MKSDFFLFFSLYPVISRASRKSFPLFFFLYKRKYSFQGAIMEGSQLLCLDFCAFPRECLLSLQFAPFHRVLRPSSLRQRLNGPDLSAFAYIYYTAKRKTTWLYNFSPKIIQGEILNSLETFENPLVRSRSYAYSISFDIRII